MQIKLFNRYWSSSAILCLAGDAALLLVAVSIAFKLRFSRESDPPFYDTHFLFRAGVFAAVILIAMYFNGRYDFHRHTTQRATFIGILQSFAVSVPILLAIYYLTYSQLTLGRGVLGISILLSVLFLIAWRLILHKAVGRELFSERVLIVGSDETSLKVAREILSLRHLGYSVVGFLDDDPDLQGKSLANPRVIGTTSQVNELARRHKVNSVVVAQTDYRGRLDMDKLLECKTSGVAVYRGAAYYEQLTGKIMLEGLRKSWLIFSPGFQVSQWIRIQKRLLDIVAALLIFVVTLPVILLAAMAIRLESPGNILFRQVRVGRSGRIFTLWKFRSMVMGAEDSEKPLWASENDSRVTRVGRLLRKTRIDELPQLWNILVGDMSLVGPRPERPEFVQELRKLSPLYKERLVVTPGLTGWAQINAPYAASLEDSLEKLSYDLYYIKNQSIFLDISIILSTLRTVLLARGGR